jgi:hypothetical protein
MKSGSSSRSDTTPSSRWNLRFPTNSAPDPQDLDVKSISTLNVLPAQEGFGFVQQKQISGWVFDDSVVREDRLLNKFAIYDCRSPRDINREQGLLILRFHLDFEKMLAIGDCADCQGASPNASATSPSAGDMESMILSAFGVSSQLGKRSMPRNASDSHKQDESRPTEKHKRVRKAGEKAVECLLDKHQHGGCFSSEASVFEVFQTFSKSHW